MKTLTSFLLGFFSSIIFAQDIELEAFASGFSSPVNIKHAGDNRLFVVEQSGYIKIVNSDAVSYTHLTLPTTPYV